MQQSTFYVFKFPFKPIPHIVYYWETRTPFMSLKYNISFPLNFNKDLDKNSNKEFVKQACLSFYVYCNVIKNKRTFPLACPLVQYLLLCLSKWK